MTLGPDESRRERQWWTLVTSGTKESFAFRSTLETENKRIFGAVPIKQSATEREAKFSFFLSFRSIINRFRLYYTAPLLSRSNTQKKTRLDKCVRVCAWVSVCLCVCARSLYVCVLSPLYVPIHIIDGAVVVIATFDPKLIFFNNSPSPSRIICASIYLPT